MFEQKKGVAMEGSLSFKRSPEYMIRYPEVGFGLALVTGCTNHVEPPGFDQYKRKALRKMRRRETLSEINILIGKYEAFFQKAGYECPLPGHLKRTVNNGFPRYNVMVDAHFMAEMCAGILVAVTDYDCFEGGLTLDLAREGENCIGMGNRVLYTRDGEIVLRDEKDIVCILCQGADEKTRVTESTRNVLFYAFAVPGILGKRLRQGLELAAEAMVEFGGGNIQTVEVH